MEQEYTGPIEIGMRFVWEPHNPQARCIVEVTRVVDPISDERRVFTIASTGDDTEEYCNDESRFREAVVPCESEKSADGQG